MKKYKKINFEISAIYIYLFIIFKNIEKQADLHSIILKIIKDVYTKCFFI